MKSTLWWLGLIFGTLSVVMLIKHGLDYGFVAPLAVILDYYEHAMKALFGWAEPFIERLLGMIREWIGWDLRLYPHWKHFCVLFLIYVTNNAKMYLTEDPEWGNGIFALVSGTTIAAVVGIAAGVVPAATASENTDETVTAILLSGIPVMGMALYFIVEGAWWRIWDREPGESWFRASFFKSTGATRWAMAILGVGMIAMAVALVLLPATMLSGSAQGMLVVAVLMLTFGLFHICLGLLWARNGVRDGRYRSISEGLKGMGIANTGFGVLGVFAGASLFVAANAGLQLLGL